jgi:hypothetical protein
MLFVSGEKYLLSESGASGHNQNRTTRRRRDNAASTLARVRRRKSEKGMRQSAARSAQESICKIDPASLL